MGFSTYFLLLLTAVLCSHAAKDNNKNIDNYETAVRTQCGFTRYPTLCVQTLSGSGSGSNNFDFMSFLVNRTISENKKPYDYYSNKNLNSEILGSTLTDETELARDAREYCNELMEMSHKRLNQALASLKKSPQKNKADIQTWLSASLTYQETCKDAVEEHLPHSNALMSEIYNRMDHLNQLASIPLSLVNRITNKNPLSTSGHRRLLLAGLEEEFPAWVSGKDRKLLQSAPIKADAIVAKDGSGNYKTVSDAVKAATGSRFVIYVKSGTYNEKVVADKDGITLIGDGKYSTIITSGSSIGGGSSLRGSATFTVTGDGFMARDIGFQNTAGPENHQAVALNVASDRSVLYRCSITGYQDTLYAHTLRQFYRECDIYGTIDFIFGNAAAVFQSCTIVLRRPRSGGAYNTILANGRTDPGQNTGFSIQNCKITIGSDFAPVKNSFSSYLGRPWKAYSRAVVMQSNIDGEISPRGWVEWVGAGASIYRTMYFAEYGNMGPGSGTTGRVGWPGFKVLGTADAAKFTVGSFIGGNVWLPSTGVAFVLVCECLFAVRLIKTCFDDQIAVIVKKVKKKKVQCPCLS